MLLGLCPHQLEPWHIKGGGANGYAFGVNQSIPHGTCHLAAH